MKRTVVSSSSSSGKSESDDDSIKTSENFEDSFDESNPLNKEMAAKEKEKAARGVKFASFEAGSDPEALRRTSPRASPRSEGSGSDGLRSGAVRGLDWSDPEEAKKKRAGMQKTQTKVFNFREDI